MKTPNEIVLWLYKSKFVKNTLRKWLKPDFKPYIEDIEQDIYAQLLKMDPEKLNRLYSVRLKDGNSQLLAYIIGMIRLGQNSAYSPWYCKYIKHTHGELVLGLHDSSYDDVNLNLALLDDEEMKIIEFYCNTDGNITDLCKVLGTSYYPTKKKLDSLKKKLS